MPPIDLLFALVLVTIVAAIGYRVIRKREQSAYRKMALAQRMHYSPRDPLRLTPRVAAHLPLPGAAAVRVIDLLYRTDEHTHHYVFTAEYTIGVTGPKRRVRRAAAFTENKSGDTPGHTVRLGPSDLPLIEQYRALIESESA